MKASALAVLLAGLQAVSAWGADAPPFRTEQDKINYGIGVQIARNYKNQGVEIKLDMVVRGLQDGLSADRLLIPEKELQKMMMAFQNELREKQAAARRAAAQAHQKQEAPAHPARPVESEGTQERR